MARYPKGSTPKLSLKLIEEICLLIRKGCYIETSAAACGISKDSLYRWLKKGKKDDTLTLERKLSDAVLVALGESEIRDLEVINNAALGSPDKLALDDQGKPIIDSDGYPVISEYGLAPNWKASAWRLERKFPNRWGNKNKLVENAATEIKIEFIDTNG